MRTKEKRAAHGMAAGEDGPAKRPPEGGGSQSQPEGEVRGGPWRRRAWAGPIVGILTSFALAVLLQAGAGKADPMQPQAWLPMVANQAGAATSPPSTPTPIASDTATPTPISTAMATSTPTVSPTNTATPPTIAIVNGDFEQGQVGWTQYNNRLTPLQLIRQGLQLDPQVQPSSGQWIGVLYAIEASEQSWIEQRVTLPNVTPLYLNANYIIASNSLCDSPWWVSFRVYAGDEPISINDRICRGDPTYWRSAYTDISQYAGQTGTLKFWLQTTHGISGDTRFYLDDIAIESVPRYNP